MTREEAINDLKVLRDYFMEQSGGAIPLCLEYAITELEHIQNVKEYAHDMEVTEEQAEKDLKRNEC